MTPDESKTLQALVGSLQREVHDLVQTVPDVYISRKEHERITQRIRLAFVILGLLLCLAVLVFVAIRSNDKAEGEDRERLRVERQEDLASATRLSEDAIVRNTCALKGVLELAQSTSTRNPVPPGLDPDLRTLVEQSRATAASFYDTALSDLNATLTQLGRDSCPASPLPAGSTG